MKIMIRKYLKKLLIVNWQAKLLCLLMALGLWLYVASSQNTVSKFPGTLPIKAINMPANLAAVYDVKQVEIKILVEPSVLQQLSAESFSATIDLSGLKEGTHQVAVNVSSIVPGVQVVAKSPESILVTMEQVVTKTVQVSEQIDGQAAYGMVPGDITFDPASVKIRGAKSIVDGVNEAIANINLSGESASFSKDVKPAVYDANNQPLGDIEVVPEQVKALISIVKGSNTKTVGIKANVTGTPAANYFISNITVNPSAVDISGVRSVVLNTDYLETSQIDVNGVTADVTKDVTLTIPSGLSVLSENATKIHVVITISSTSISREFNVTNFKTTPGSPAILSSSPSSIKVTCSGSISQINSLSTNDLSLVLDLSSKQADSSGNVTVPISNSDIQTPSGITVSRVAVSSVSVKIK